MFVRTLLAAIGTMAAPSILAGELALLTVNDGYWQVGVLEIESGGIKIISQSPGDKTRITWFPDGHRLLVSSAEGRVFQLGLDGIESDIPVFPARTVDAVLSPQGDRIAYSISTSTSMDDNNIWISDLSGENPRKLTSLPRLQHEPVWSLDGSSLFFLSGDGDQSHDVWRLNIASGDIEQLTVNALYNFDVAPGPKGVLAMSSNRSGHYDLWLLHSDGRNEAITADAFLDGRPSWSADGQRLAFESSRGGDGIDIWLVDLDGKALTQLTRSGHARQPAWRPEAAK